MYSYDWCAGGGGGGEGGTSIFHKKIYKGEILDIQIGSGGTSCQDGTDSIVAISGETHKAGGGKSHDRMMGYTNAVGGVGGLGETYNGNSGSTGTESWSGCRCIGGTGGGTGAGTGSLTSSGPGLDAALNSGAGGGGGADNALGGRGGDGYVWVEYWKGE